MTEASTEVPRRIWFMWLQGLDRAPDIVRKCWASWEKYNPNWELILLDESNLEQYVRVQEILGKNREHMSRAALADVTRINLLANYGGVWVDATCFCCIPLDEWLGRYATSGFFAFGRPKWDRLLSSWFLASSEDCYLTMRFCEEVNSFWSANHFPSQNTTRTVISRGILRRVLNRNPRSIRLWFSFVASKVLRVYPYSWFHYLFAEVVRKDELCEQIWSQTKHYSADIPHKLQSSGLLEPIPEDLKHDIDARKDPLYKLTWKYDENKCVKGSTLYHLLHSHHLS
jgi:hypothetical protein